MIDLNKQPTESLKSRDSNLKIVPNMMGVLVGSVWEGAWEYWWKKIDNASGIGARTL